MTLLIPKIMRPRLLWDQNLRDPYWDYLGAAILRPIQKFVFFFPSFWIGSALKKKILAADPVFSKIKMYHFWGLKWSEVVIAILNHYQNRDLSFPLGQQDRAKLSLEAAHADIFRINLGPPIPWPWPWPLQFERFEKTNLEYERGTL